ncbi:ATP-dependent acyl-CoA ligase [Neorhizobium galegae]|uniref:ATP-dependent acyl-CoA ligase n=1 Tax=Neorhizobium galegae TaxID=399 RepID=UPI00210639D3|nr:ATP-dependent acyl-CoA ligase [Neorhizobium galegae]
MNAHQIELSREAKVFRLAETFSPSMRTFPQMISLQAERYGDRPLVKIDDRTLSFSAAKELAAAAGNTLRAAGVKAGDTVAIMCSNRLDFLQILLGCAWCGAIAVPINTASRGAQLAHILQNSGAKLALVEGNLLGAMANLQDAPLPLEQIWTVGDLPDDLALRWPHHQIPEMKGDMEAYRSRPSDTMAILYTSGTTGLSKGVCCPHAQYFWWGVHTAALLGVADDDVLLTCLPLFHTNALNTFFQALLTGASLVIDTRFSASRFWTTLAAHGATVTYLLGAMVPILLSKDATDVEKQHKTRIALAPGVPPQFHAPFTERSGVALLDGYGSTETNFVVGALLHDQKPGTMGKARPGFEIAVFDENDNQVPDGTPGELVVRAAEPFSIATGYFGMSEKTVEAWRNLWFHTGDRVTRDADGYVQFLDRMKDAIRRRGENISSFEVEQVLISHPSVENAAVFPVRSELAEDEVMASIVLKNGFGLSASELLDFCQPRMSYFSVPRFVDFIDALPLTENGKVQKFKLIERGVMNTTWDREKVGYKVAR